MISLDCVNKCFVVMTPTIADLDSPWLSALAMPWRRIARVHAMSVSA